MNFDKEILAVLQILFYMVVFAVALGLAELCVSFIESIVNKVRRMVR